MLYPKYQKYLTTKEERQIEIPKNWVDFARLTSIRSGGDIIPFNPYPYQVELVTMMQERSVCIVKSRQLGISETVCCYMLWRACLNPGYLGVVFSKTQVDTSLLARRMKRMIESIGLQTTTENLGDVEISGRGRILFKNSKPDSARGLESVVDVFFDEFAFIESAKEIFDSVAPSQQMLGDKARSIVVSTPNGKAGAYWDLLSGNNGDIDIEMLCEGASKGVSPPFQYWIDTGSWAKILIHWLEHPIYGGNPNFLKEVHERQKLSWSVIKQEYDLSFQESETNYFSADIIRLGAIGEYSEPESKCAYFIGIDTATTGEDFGVCVVLKLSNDDVFSIAKIYRKRQESSQYHMFHMSRIIDDYSPIAIGIEVTGGTGQVYLEQLSQAHSYRKFHAVRTTGDSKPAMLDRLKLLIESEKLIYPTSSPIVDELLNFKRNGKLLEAAKNKHDDILMACCFALSAASEEKYI